METYLIHFSHFSLHSELQSDKMASFFKLSKNAFRNELHFKRKYMLNRSFFFQISVLYVLTYLSHERKICIHLFCYNVKY